MLLHCIVSFCLSVNILNSIGLLYAAYLLRTFIFRLLLQIFIIIQWVGFLYVSSNLLIFNHLLLRKTYVSVFVREPQTILFCCSLQEELWKSWDPLCSMNLYPLKVQNVYSSVHVVRLQHLPSTFWLLLVLFSWTKWFVYSLFFPYG